MIRTTLSFCLLFGGLLLISKWLHQSTDSQPAGAEEIGAPAAVVVPADARPIDADRTSAAAPPVIQLVTYDELSDLLNSLRPLPGSETRVKDKIEPTI